jgi:hypothetical protein
MKKLRILTTFIAPAASFHNSLMARGCGSHESVQPTSVLAFMSTSALLRSPTTSLTSPCSCRLSHMAVTVNGTSCNVRGQLTVGSAGDSMSALNLRLWLPNP